MRNPENSAGAVFVRLGGELYDRLEDFRRRQAKIPHRSEALRSLIERALTASDSAAGDETARPSPSEDGS